MIFEEIGRNELGREWKTRDRIIERKEVRKDGGRVNRNLRCLSGSMESCRVKGLVRRVGDIDFYEITHFLSRNSLSYKKGRNLSEIYF